ncbi:hypothetical protein PAPYR_8960 [Paratrimastix pyriformis]|uniref:Rad60/SUMO-like domain-containing protein n=1 Tax=Paratrimastix pyriformis TaxID=342808 RepID=A0ABQ8U9M5_9EUKA|nr:hypothetical protein PAPYR_8960 [Paratrimastix pyriformis]|eukprot:GAFH01003392.1.p2 GENE.GAFH01003392.1~~GAFH01003392.1.p2  ORF type:complete len:283 (+),score=72.94 GAFH01003392.1:67-915(+)
MSATTTTTVPEAALVEASAPNTDNDLALAMALQEELNREEAHTDPIVTGGPIVTGFFVKSRQSKQAQEEPTDDGQPDFEDLHDQSCYNWEESVDMNARQHMDIHAQAKLPECFVAPPAYDVGDEEEEDEATEEVVAGPRPHKPTRRQMEDVMGELRTAKRKASTELRVVLTVNQNRQLSKVLMCAAPNSFKEFLKTASTKFQYKGKLAFKRVFTLAGEEITDLVPLFQNHEVIMSSGENYLSPQPHPQAPPPAETATADPVEHSAGFVDSAPAAAPSDEQHR